MIAEEKKTYVEPEAVVFAFDAKDVIATSCLATYLEEHDDGSFDSGDYDSEMIVEDDPWG